MTQILFNSCKSQLIWAMVLPGKMVKCFNFQLYFFFNNTIWFGAKNCYDPATQVIFFLVQLYSIRQSRYVFLILKELLHLFSPLEQV